MTKSKWTTWIKNRDDDNIIEWKNEATPYIVYSTLKNKLKNIWDIKVRYGIRYLKTITTVKGKDKAIQKIADTKKLIEQLLYRQRSKNTTPHSFGKELWKSS